MFLSGVIDSVKHFWLVYIYRYIVSTNWFGAGSTGIRPGVCQESYVLLSLTETSCLMFLLDVSQVPEDQDAMDDVV